MTSEIRTNTIKNRVGLGTVSYTNTGIVVSGIVTANSFSGSISGTTGTFSDTTESSSPITGSVKLLGGLGVVKNIRTSGGLYATGLAGLNITHSADINGDLDVDGHTNLDNVSIAGVVTATTFVGNGDFVELDVDGHTNLDNVSVAGVSTFADRVTISGGKDLFMFDNGVIRLGNNSNTSDFQMFHNGTHTYLNNATGSLYLSNTSTGGSINLSAKTGQNGIVVKEGPVRLYYDNTLRISTSGVGATVYGNLDVTADIDVDGHTNLDNVSIAGITTFSDRAYLAHDLTITGTAPRVIFTDTNNNSDYRINVDAGYFQIQDITNSYANRFNIASNGAVSINHAGTGDNTLHIGCTSNAGGIIIKAPGDHYANMVIDSNRSGANNGIFNLAGRWNGNDVAYMSFTTGTDTTNKDDGYIRFYTRLSGSSLTERLKIQSNGDVYLNPTQGSTGVSSGAIRRFNAGLDYWGGTAGSSNAIKYAVHGQSDDNMYGIGISNSLLEVQSQVDIGFFAGGAGSGTGRRVEQARLKSTGRFGLGVSNPDQKLHISAPSGDVYFQTDTTVNGGLLIYVQGTQRGVFANDSAFSGGQSDIGIGAKGNLNFRTGTSSYTQRLRIDTEGVTALGPFASYAYSNLTSFFNIHNGARVNTGGANQFAAPKGGFCDNARYELEAALISYSTSAQQTIQAQNGAQLKIGNSRSNWSYYNNLPNYLLGHAATDCINTSNYTLTLKATMTVFLQRSNGWNSVPLSGWELVESNTNIYPGNTDSRLYVKTLAAGSYSGWDSDSAMYFFVL